MKPIIPLIFVNAKDENKLIGEGTLVDSGADCTTISEHLAIKLNLPLPPEISYTKGIGGKTPVKETQGDIIVVRGNEAYKLTIPILVILNGGTELPYPLLGRYEVFKYFDITFRERIFKLDFIKKDDNLKRIPIPEKLKGR